MFNETMAGYYGFTPHAPHASLFDDYFSQLTVEKKTDATTGLREYILLTPVMAVLLNKLTISLNYLTMSKRILCHKLLMLCMHLLMPYMTS